MFVISKKCASIGQSIRLSVREAVIFRPNRFELHSAYGPAAVVIVVIVVVVVVIVVVVVFIVLVVVVVSRD